MTGMLLRFGLGNFIPTAQMAVIDVAKLSVARCAHLGHVLFADLTLTIREIPIANGGSHWLALCPLSELPAT